MARSGSSDDSGRPDRPDEEPTESIDYGDTPTQYADYGWQGQHLPGPPDSPGSADPAESQNTTPWFRRRPVLIAWISLIVLMIALVIWGIIQLTGRGPGDTTVPSTISSTTSATTTTATTTATTAATTTTRTAATTAAPPPAAPPTGGSPNEPPQHRHHLPPLPSMITIPPIPRAPEVPTVITLPPHL